MIVHWYYRWSTQKLGGIIHSKSSDTSKAPAAGIPRRCLRGTRGTIAAGGITWGEFASREMCQIRHEQHGDVHQKWW